MNINSEHLLICDEYSQEEIVNLANIIREGDDFRIFTGYDFHEEALKLLLDDYNKHMWLIYRKDDEKLIGYVGFFVNKDGYEPEIYIAKEERRKGYGYEVLSLLCDRLLHDGLDHRDKKLSCSILYASCLEENIASNRLLQKCGFKETEKEYIDICQLFVDPITDNMFENHINEYCLKR
jgi:RimJ/RimL family protein N-acetyltransferase